MVRVKMLSHPRWWQTGLLAALLVLTVGCAEVRLISDYDQVTDEQVNALQRMAEQLFTSLERNAEFPDCSHASHEDFYEAAAVELNLLIARNEIRPRNRVTQDQLAALKDSVNTLEERHLLVDQVEPGEEHECISVEEVALLRSGFDVSFRAILKLELAKKRGEEEGS